MTTLWQWTVSMASVEQQIQTAGLSSRHKNTCNWCICLEMGISHFLFAVTLPSAQSKEKKLLQHCEYGCNIVSISWIKYRVSLSCHVRFNTGWMDLSQLRWCVDSSVNGVLSHISHLCLHSLFEEVHSQTESSERLVQINKAKHFLFGLFVRASCFFKICSIWPHEIWSLHL